ncbi:4-galactosyl-N-acetylglucosaminide 3-alpha-L-fucosyltransferase FUT6-like isoform X1 [Mya arenaria]|uniref:4-galactosyl-N-acetylglucosaminide 3-alpha-L-fucosyltransferase FUT6-like isoform X1 n=2 Tax=Mya arenaria TaxID=6604 RepID=UPI0022E6DFFD|nr:4-galactosyl-N-acetylglucosaminide 3-alpha-L-fucosyltransferase FUT6-like isoform X1 [Mya arenaria]
MRTRMAKRRWILAIVFTTILFHVFLITNKWFGVHSNQASVRMRAYSPKATSVLGETGLAYSPAADGTNSIDAITKDDLKHIKGKFSNTKSPFIDPKLNINTSEAFNLHNILWWNPPKWMNDWIKETDERRCSYTNCKVTTDRTILKASSAVVFSVADTGMGSRPPLTPNERNPNQAWIFYTLESPYNILWQQEHKRPDWLNMFNWSWTYKPDSDIFHPYGILQTRAMTLQRNYSEIFRKKTKLAAWAVSHCGAVSKRDRYVELLNHLSSDGNASIVDIFGSCKGALSKPSKEQIENILDENYKFYLGFENSLCPDYITEKFFMYYKRDVITIVRGMGEYEKYFPKGSFLNTKDFPSPEDLAKFIVNLAVDEERYIEYLRMKDRFSVKERGFMYQDAVCSICHKLNNIEEYRKTIVDFLDFLGTCVQPKDV